MWYTWCMLMGTKKLGDELYTYTSDWDGEELLFYRMNQITVDGIHSGHYNPEGGGQVHMASMISWKRDASNGESFVCQYSDSPIHEYAWLKYGFVLTEEEYFAKPEDHWKTLAGY